MKVLLVNSDDGLGGAARAAMRLHLGLRALDVEASLLVQKKQTDLATVIGPKPLLGYWRGELRPHLDALPTCLYPERTGALFSPAVLPGPWHGDVATFDPEIVNLHWVCNGQVRFESLRKLKRPLVWTLHDSWVFTGGCHLPGDCRRYRHSCGACPVLGSKRERDLSRKIWQRKQKVLADIDLTIVAPSRWLADCAKRSSLLAEKRIEVIPNGLDTHKFKPLDKREARKLLELPQDIPLVLYCGAQAEVDANKGAALLLDAVRSVANCETNRFDLVVFGTSATLGFKTIGVRSHSLGRLGDDVSLRLTYAAADLLVLPSREENLPYTVMEAMACGLPCVAYDVGGVSDLIDHMVNGCLVPPYDTLAFEQEIGRLLKNPSLLREMASKSRDKVVAEFSQETVAGRYLDIYRSLV